MEPPTLGMTAIDYAVFVGLLGASLLIGAYFGLIKRQKSTADFLVGGRSMPVLPTAISLLASYISAILILGVPSELYYHGSLLWEAMYGNVIAFPLAAYIFIPTFYRLKLTSVYEYLELRFDSRLVRLLASLTFSLQATLYLGVVVFAPSIALHTVAGFPQWASILCIGVVGTLYTTVGGLRAVVWTDVLQGLLMFGGLLAIIIQGSIQLGGLGEAFRISNERGRLQFLDFNPSPFVRHSTLVCFLGQSFNSLATYGCQQTSVQRYCSMASLKQAVWSLLLNIPLLTFIVSLGWVAGVVVFATYADCDPLAAGYISNKDAVVPYFVLHRFAALPGMLGLFIASLLSGSLSSVSSLLNALSAVAWEDVVSKIKYFNTKGESTKLAITKCLGLLFGVVMIGLAFAVSNLTGLIQTTFTLSGAVSGPLLGVFLLALFVPWANKYGATLGILCGHAFSMWIGFGALTYGRKPAFLPLSTAGCDTNSTMWLSSHGANESRLLVAERDPFLYNATRSEALTSLDQELGWPEKLFTISYLYYCLMGCCVTMTIGILVSSITAACTTTSVSAELLHPLVQRFATSGKHHHESVASLTSGKSSTKPHSDKIRPKQQQQNEARAKSTAALASQQSRVWAGDNEAAHIQHPRYRSTGEAHSVTSAL